MIYLKMQKRKYENDLLENAKKNLVSFSFFGLTEYQRLSQYLFEKTFKNKIKFSQPFKNKIKFSQPFFEINDRIGLKSLEEENQLIEIICMKLIEIICMKLMKIIIWILNCMILQQRYFLIVLLILRIYI